VSSPATTASSQEETSKNHGESIVCELSVNIRTMHTDTCHRSIGHDLNFSKDDLHSFLYSHHGSSTIEIGW
jgi:hypothetical protein